MNKPKKLTIDFYIHDAGVSGSPQIIALTRKHGNDGWSTYFRLLELLCSEGDFRLDLSETWRLEAIASTFSLRDRAHLVQIVDYCVTLGLFDRQPWDSQKIVFSADFIERNKTQILLKLRDQRTYALRKASRIVFERDDYKCVYCGAEDDLTIDHVLPISKGGTDEASNLVTACRSCNSSKRDRTPDEWRGGAK